MLWKHSLQNYGLSLKDQYQRTGDTSGSSEFYYFQVSVTSQTQLRKKTPGN